jgi:hypothetical protein
VSKHILAVVKQNDSKVRAAMKAAGVKVGQSVTKGQMNAIVDKVLAAPPAEAKALLTGKPGSRNVKKADKRAAAKPATAAAGAPQNSSLIALARKGAAYRTKPGAKAGLEAEVKDATISAGQLLVTYGDGTVAVFKAAAKDLTPSVKNKGFLHFQIAGGPLKAPKLASMKPADQKTMMAGIAAGMNAAKGKAPKAAPVQPATKGPGANKGAKGEAFCSKCGRDNGRPTSPDCRNVGACKARVAKQAAV